MKNFFLIGFILFVCISSVQARETLVPNLSVIINTGNITQPALLASPGGEVFIEFSTATKFVHEEGLISFNGEILPPSIIELPDQRPKLRMNPLVSFELGSDSGEPVLFIDRFDAQNARNILRENYLNPGTISRSAWVKLIVPIEDPAVGRAHLWEYIGPDEGWAIVGGIMDEPSPEGVRVFSAILRRTGVYTVFDIDPAPKHEDEFDGPGETIEGNLSDENIDAFWNESNGEIPEGMTWEEFQAMALDAQNNQYEDSGISDEIPATMGNPTAALEAQKMELMSQLAEIQDPQIFSLTQELINTIDQKIKLLPQKQTLLFQKESLENLLPNITTEGERATITSQLRMIEEQLSLLNEKSIDARILELEASLNGDTRATTPTITEPQITPPPPAPKGAIPKDGSLPKTGAEAMNNTESFSLIFPIALFVVLFFIIASSVIASRRRSA